MLGNSSSQAVSQRAERTEKIRVNLAHFRGSGKGHVSQNSLGIKNSRRWGVGQSSQGTLICQGTKALALAVGTGCEGWIRGVMTFPDKQKPASQDF